MKKSISNTSSDGPEPRLTRHKNHAQGIFFDAHRVEENCYGNKGNGERIT
jgi:hypothetical protein